MKVHYNSLCGSDLSVYKGHWHGTRYPIVPGHEWAGVVEEVAGGDGAWIGQRVVGDLIAQCHTCGPCRDGLPVMCENIVEIGFSVDGGCAGYVAVPIANLYAVPDGLDLVTASQAEPVSVVLHALDRVVLRPGERVAVLGCGGIGLLLLQAARAMGAAVTLAVDPVAERRELAVALGARVAAAPDDVAEPTSCRDKVDVAFAGSGHPASVAGALDLIRAGGRVALVGYQVGATHPIETAKLPLAYATLVGVMGPGGKFRKAVDLLADGFIDARAGLTDVIMLDDYSAALDRALNRTNGTVRVTFDLRGE